VLCGTALSAGTKDAAKPTFRQLRVPPPDHPDAIGTQVGAIDTFVTGITVSPPARVTRLGLSYEERRGEIEGVGWGGFDIANVRRNQHYKYRVSYVLRIPQGWDGTLLVFRHGSSPLAVWIDLEQRLGPRSIGRFFHELADRYTSDVALDPRRRWAFFAVNQVPVDANGELTTFLIDENGVLGDAVHPIVDVPIARDTTRAGQWLLERLEGRFPRLTIGAGQSTGALMNLRLNTGSDSSNPGVLAGDNHVTAYDSASGRIHDAFINFQGAGPALVDPVRRLSAPTLFVAGEAGGPEMLNVTAFVKSAIDAGLTPEEFTRIYAIRNMPQVDADLVLGASRMGLEYAEPNIEHAKGGGERLKGLSGALLDALERWITRGTPPPASRFNGVRLDPPPGSPAVTAPDASPASMRQEDSRMWMTVGERRFAITLADNAAARAFAAQLPLTLDMSELNGNEKHADLPKPLPANASRPGTIRNGDLMLYRADTLVVFSLTFQSSYSYTRLGRVDDPSDLPRALGPRGVRVAFSKD
jgi:hypothetical protein